MTKAERAEEYRRRSLDTHGGIYAVAVALLALADGQGRILTQAAETPRHRGVIRGRGWWTPRYRARLPGRFRCWDPAASPPRVPPARPRWPDVRRAAA